MCCFLCSGVAPPSADQMKPSLQRRPPRTPGRVPTILGTPNSGRAARPSSCAATCRGCHLPRRPSDPAVTAAPPRNHLWGPRSRERPPCTQQDLAAIRSRDTLVREVSRPPTPTAPAHLRRLGHREPRPGDRRAVPPRPLHLGDGAPARCNSYDIIAVMDPPSTLSDWPCTALERSEARYSIASAHSSGLMSLLMGLWSAASCTTSS